jgi:hypothetical protein
VAAGWVSTVLVGPWSRDPEQEQRPAQGQCVLRPLRPAGRRPSRQETGWPGVLAERRVPRRQSAGQVNRAQLVGQGFAQIVADIPPYAEPVGDQTQEVAFGANAFKEHHQLELEEDDRINAGASTGA